MSTYIFIWNAKTNPQPQIAKAAKALLAGKEVQGFDWSTGGTRYFPPASEFLLYRTRKEPRGIFAYGKLVDELEEDLHWDPDRAAKGEKALYVKMIPESLVDPDINPELVLTPEALQQAGFERRKGIWCPMDRVQRSGITVDGQDAARIRDLFDSLQRQVHRSISGSENKSRARSH